MILRSLTQQYPNAEITLTGHSLGGAIAQVLADASALSAITFNAPGARETLTSFGTTVSNLIGPIQSKPASQEITNYRVYGDLVSGVGDQIGRSVTLAPPIPSWQVDLVPFGTAKAMHEITTVFERLFNNAPTSTDFGPTLQSIALAAGAMQTIYVNTGFTTGIYGAILPITNLLVGAGDALFIDPQDLDLYHFAADPGSPNVRTVTFPFLLNLDARFNLEWLVGNSWTSLGLFGELDTYDFGIVGVDQFRFFILDSNTWLRPTAVEPFAFGVTFASEGVFNGMVTASATTAASVPEPATLSLFGLGLTCLIILRRRKPRHH